MADELERAETAASTDIIADAAPAEGGKEQLAETLARPVPAP